MNKARLEKLLWYRVRLRPRACGVLPGPVFVPRDNVWIVQAVRPDDVIELHTMTTGYVVQLGAGHIHHFDSDPMSETDGLGHGFLTLTVQVLMSGCRLWVEPLSPYMRRGLINR
jgi:hypothetical protein